ncbi:alpha/beta fold hydrolase [Roseibium sp. MB-4]
MIWTTRRRSDQGGLACIQEGEGPRVLLLHGVGLQADAWAAQVPDLASHFQVIAPDMPGHGHSGRLVGRASLSAYSDTVAQLLDGPTVVAGHSMGAMIALDIAARYPELVAGVAALNSIYRRSDAAKQTVLHRAQNLGSETGPNPEPTLDRWFGTEPSEARSACEAWLKGADLYGYRTAYDVFAREDGPSDQVLMSLKCPAFFMTGSLEPNSTPAMSQAMAALTPNGQVHVIETAAHMMPMTHHVEVTRALLAFAMECHS